MLPCSRLLAGLMVSLTLGACAPSGMDMSTRSSAAAQTRGYTVNPAPRERYRITMTLHDAPGPFASMRALAQYDVENRECLSPPKDNPGGRSAPLPTEDIEIPLTRVGENAYEGVLYADYMRDEDYTGRGICHWKLMQFRVHMKATGAQSDTLFIPSIQDEKLIPAQGEVAYFNKAAYPRDPESTLDEFPYFGSSRDRFGPDVKETDLFSVAFAVRKEATP